MVGAPGVLDWGKAQNESRGPEGPRPFLRYAPAQPLSPAHSEYMLYLLHNGVGTSSHSPSVHSTWCGAG